MPTQDEANIYQDNDTGLLVWVDPNTGAEHRLGCKEATEEESSLLMAASTPIIPVAQWVVVTEEECRARVRAFLKWALLNQRSHGSCVGFAAAGALMWDLWSLGYPLSGKLSGAYIYAWINGNRDAGASIPAALTALKEHGTCLESTVGWDTIYRRNMPSGADAEAQRFKLETGSRLSGHDAIGSALQVGKCVEIGVQAGRRFGTLDDEGILGYDGRGSNHATFVAPICVKKKNGTGFKWPMINSWGPFGINREGWGYVDARHIEGGGGGFYHGTPNYDPNAEQAPAI
jgi:hypothetical protein